MGRRVSSARRSNERRKSKVVMVFGESSNDIDSICQLAQAVRQDLPTCLPVRSPPILSRTAAPQKRDDMASEVAKLTRAAAIRHEVVSVIAHRDCDEVEPAHVRNSQDLQARLARAGVPQPIAATPAFELEAWWYLWPSAVRSVRSC